MTQGSSTGHAKPTPILPLRPIADQATLLPIKMRIRLG